MSGWARSLSPRAAPGQRPRRDRRAVRAKPASAKGRYLQVGLRVLDHGPRRPHRPGPGPCGRGRAGRHGVVRFFPGGPTSDRPKHETSRCRRPPVAPPGAEGAPGPARRGDDSNPLDGAHRRPARWLRSTASRCGRTHRPSRGATMDNPRPEKVAVVDEVRERLDGAQAPILTEYRGLTVREMAELRQALERPAATTRSTRTPWSSWRSPAAAMRRCSRFSRARPPSPSCRARSPPSPRRCATTPGPTRTWWSRAACTARACLSAQELGSWPTFHRAMCSWPGWPAPSPPRCSSWPASSRPCPGALPTGCRRSSTRRAARRPRPMWPGRRRAAADAPAADARCRGAVAEARRRRGSGGGNGGGRAAPTGRRGRRAGRRRRGLPQPPRHRGRRPSAEATVRRGGRAGGGGHRRSGNGRGQRRSPGRPSRPSTRR